jgi:hypothetical protein
MAADRSLVAATTARLRRVWRACTAAVLVMLLVPVTATGSSLLANEQAHATATQAPTFVPIRPARLLDTRPGEGTVDGSFSATGVLQAGRTLSIDVIGRAGIPVDAVAAVLNVTAIDPADRGYLTIHRCDAPRPVASNLNYRPGTTTGNMVLADIDRDDAVCVFTRATTHLVVDATGYVPAGGTAVPIDPARLLETRPGAETVDGLHRGGGPVPADDTITVDVAGRADIPDDAIAVLVNVTAVDPAGNGYLTLHRCNTTRPVASNLNYRPGTTTGNMVLAELDTDGRTCIYTRTTTHLVVDVVGVVTSRARSAERAALESLYTAMGGSRWERSDGWLDDPDPCRWWGVECDVDGVIALRLTGNGLTGPLPPTVRGLSRLEVLSLTSNRITSIPPEIRELVRLERLGVSDNRLSVLPAEIGDLTRLRRLHADSNDLTTLPPEIGRLDGIRELLLSNNQLTTLPAAVGDLTALEWLSVAHNELTSLPSRIGDLAELTGLEAQDNRLVALPPEIDRLGNLEYLAVDHNRITTLPPQLGELSNLTTAWLNDNDISGSITAAMAALRTNATSLSFLKLGGRGCPTIGDPAVAAWVETFDPGWDSGCE